ncbi:MAG: hypothetical protein EOO20_12580 [Chryseobacterium sp.]|nr:MAG: hypothetical protein EOO20_12580 [Chryseobacterium sp.]
MRRIKNILIACSMLVNVISCQGKTSPAHKDYVSDAMLKNTTNDEHAFRLVLAQLKMLLKTKNLNASSALLNFPFFTARVSENDRTGAATDPVAIGEYSKYKNDIFNADVIRLLPTYTEDQLSEIDSKTDDPYYLSLTKLTDAGSQIYEVYFQYPEKGTNAESFFGFVFGKVHGKYKAIGMYGKWPVK